MSLTSHLKDTKSPVTRFMKGRFPNVGAIRPAWREQVGHPNTIRPKRDPGGHWSTLGTAIDYRLRYYFPAPEGRSLVAEWGVAELGAGIGPVDRLTPAGWGRLGNDFLGSLTALQHKASPGTRLPRALEDRLCRHCFVLALFEQLFRAGPGIGSALYTLPAGATVSDLLGLAASSWVSDLRAMSWAFYDGFSELLARPAVLNPTFDGSLDVGAADADMIVGRCLLEIKTTIDPRALPSGIVYQLIGYVLLDYSDEFGIDAVGVYLSRQAILVCWPLEEILSTVATGPANLPRLRRDFQTMLRE